MPSPRGRNSPPGKYASTAGVGMGSGSLNIDRATTALDPTTRWHRSTPSVQARSKCRGDRPAAAAAASGSASAMCTRSAGAAPCRTAAAPIAPALVPTTRPADARSTPASARAESTPEM